MRHWLEKGLKINRIRHLNDYSANNNIKKEGEYRQCYFHHNLVFGRWNMMNDLNK